MEITVLPSTQHYLSVHEMVNSYATTTSSSSSSSSSNDCSSSNLIT